MKLKTTLTNPKISKRIEIELPANYSTIEDALLRLNTENTVNVKGKIEDEYGRGIVDINFQNCNVFELNYLAELTQNFADETSHMFIGAYFLMGEDKVTVDKAINLAMNIKSNNIVCCQPARDERDLAEFYIENELIADIKDVSDDAYQWIKDHTDYEELGAEIMQDENGIFISDAYVTMGELDSIYNGSFIMPTLTNYVFKLEIGFNQEKDDGSVYTLSLPISHAEIERMMCEMEVKSLSELTCYKFQSIIPSLEPMDFCMTDIEILNQLAYSIHLFRENNEFVRYKAMVDALEIIDLESVNHLCEYVGEFELKQNVRSFSDYGKSKFQGTVPDELLECLDTNNYGTNMAEKDGVSMTSYGALIPKDGVPLLERFSTMEEMQASTMTMGQTM